MDRPVSTQNTSRTEAPSITHRSLASIPSGTGIGPTSEAMPMIDSRLNRFEPSTLPSATPPSRFSAAARVVASSGSEVPTATMVSPITASLTPRSRATPTAPSTSRSAPSGRPISPRPSSTAMRQPGRAGSAPSRSAVSIFCRRVRHHSSVSASAIAPSRISPCTGPKVPPKASAMNRTEAASMIR
jgi:hypothetical protein